MNARFLYTFLPLLLLGADWPNHSVNQWVKQSPSAKQPVPMFNTAAWDTRCAAGYVDGCEPLYFNSLTCRWRRFVRLPLACRQSYDYHPRSAWDHHKLGAQSSSKNKHFKFNNVSKIHQIFLFLNLRSEIALPAALAKFLCRKG